MAASEQSTESSDPGASVPVAVSKFWDRFYAANPAAGGLSQRDQAAARRALAFFGDVRGRHLIDIGCGRGEATVFFAALGARVTAIDVSEIAVTQTRDLAAQLGVADRVTALAGDVSTLRLGTPADFAFGIMVLHHIEPFPAFPTALARLLTTAGRAFFLENNASSRLLMWARTNLAGHAWIRKDSDPLEYPLTPQEIAELRAAFDVEIEYPSMVYFQLIASQALGGLMGPPLRALDGLLYRSERLRRHSYHQYLMLALRA